MAAERLAVYRNNVLGGLSQVLAAAYPSVVHALGLDTFHQAGRGFAARQPPGGPQMWSYGEGLAEFLEQQPAGRVPPWLPDLARLDRAMHEAYFAHDAQPLDPGRLAALTAVADLSRLRFALHPSLRLISSDWPVHSLWHAAREGRPLPEPVPTGSPQTVLVARPGLEVLCRRLAPWQAGFFAVLLDGGTLGEAASHAPPADPVAAVQGELAGLLGGGLITGFAAAT